MQFYSKRHISHRAIQVDESTPPDALDRLRRIQLFETLRAEGCSEATALGAIGRARATLFRWRRRHRESGVRGLAARSRAPRSVRTPDWTRARQWAVWRKRRTFPFMGKARLRVMLARNGLHLSESTIGRMLKKGIRLKHIRPCSFLRGRTRPRRRRDFSGGHAQRWRSGMKASSLGELVQTDHMTVHREGQILKEFKAVDPVGRQLVARVYSRATARNAARFLKAVIRDLPHPLRSIQVDGGSEFMAEFDTACNEVGKLPKVGKLLGYVCELAVNAAAWECITNPSSCIPPAPVVSYVNFYFEKNCYIYATTVPVNASGMTPSEYAYAFDNSGDWASYRLLTPNHAFGPGQDLGCINMR